MKPISVRDIDFKVGTVLQTVEDFVVIESMDPNVLEPHLHTRSIRYRGAKTIVNLSQIRGVVVPVVQGGAEPTINAPQLRGEVGQPVSKTSVPTAPAGYKLVQGPASQVKREPAPNGLPKRHQHVKTEPQYQPSITQTEPEPTSEPTQEEMRYERADG